MVVQSYEYNKNYWAINCIFLSYKFQMGEFMLSELYLN